MRKGCENPWAFPAACETCDDVRVVLFHGKPIPCPKCGQGGAPGSVNLDPQAYAAFRSAHMKARAPMPELCELDLTPDEFKTYTLWRDLHPSVHKLTVLGWIEGLRYDPRKDPGFMAEVREFMETWTARMEAIEAARGEPVEQRRKAA